LVNVLVQVSGGWIKLENMQPSTGNLSGLAVRERMPARSTA
jgi:hypothetical protein